MLKKWMTLLVALMMALSSVAFATEESAAKSEQTMMQLYINPQLLNMEGVVDDETNDIINTIVETLNGMSWTTTKDEGICQMTFAMHDNEVYDYTVTVDEKALHVFSSFFPHSAIKVNFEKLAELFARIMETEQVQQLASQVDQIDLSGLMTLLDAVSAALPGYLEDVETVAAAVTEAAQGDEEGTYLYMTVTSHHVADLFTAWLTRLKGDETLLAILDELALNTGLAMEPLSMAIDELLNDLQAAKAETAQEIAALGLYSNEDGSMTYELTLGNTLLLAVDTYQYEGMDCLDVMIVAAQDGTDDWQATYDGVMNGTNYYDTIMGFSAMMQSDVDYGYDGVQVYIVTAGTSLAVTSEVENSDIGTENWKETGMVSLDIFSGEEEINIGGVAWETKLVEKLQAPSLDDKYVMDVLAFPMDLLLNGLPEYFEKLETAAPEFMQLYQELLVQMLDEAGVGDIVSNFILTDEITEEITIEVLEETSVENTNTTVNSKIEDF